MRAVRDPHAAPLWAPRPTRVTRPDPDRSACRGPSRNSTHCLCFWSLMVCVLQSTCLPCVFCVGRAEDWPPREDGSVPMSFGCLGGTVIQPRHVARLPDVLLDAGTIRTRLHYGFVRHLLLQKAEEAARLWGNQTLPTNRGLRRHCSDDLVRLRTLMCPGTSHRISHISFLCRIGCTWTWAGYDSVLNNLTRVFDVTIAAGDGILGDVTTSGNNLVVAPQPPQPVAIALTLCIPQYWNSRMSTVNNGAALDASAMTTAINDATTAGQKILDDAKKMRNDILDRGDQNRCEHQFSLILAPVHFAHCRCAQVVCRHRCRLLHRDVCDTPSRVVFPVSSMCDSRLSDVTPAQAICHDRPHIVLAQIIASDTSRAPHTHT